MLLQIGLLILTHLLLPVFFLIWLWREDKSSKLDWLLTLLVVGLFNVFIFLTGHWDWLSYYLRFALAIAFVVVALKSFNQLKSLPLYPSRTFKNYLALGTNSLVLVLFLATLGSFIPQGYRFNETPIQLAFPLKHGTYYVAHGGNSSAINYHNVNPAQRYALDIVKLNLLGTRANGIYSTELTDYAIFGETLYSPCDGTIGDTVNDLPNLIPPEIDRKHPAGNYILVQCTSADIVMAHLLRGSIARQVGELVKTGDPIAKIGNSGNTSEPHLHIHARKKSSGIAILKGAGVPIVFADRFLVRNSLVLSK